ncbi:MAG: hypothetical protein LC768_00395 [Acidobacteria bacterium]|nr:hypothetical protein [Acidobacteriota bacterium]MCA1636796.1 hypothetical protein [Acidobacteriota bacterium]
MEFSFELDDLIINQVRFLDKILNGLNVANIEDNPDFLINRESAGTFFLQIQILPKNRNTVPIHIFLEGDGLRIDIDGIPETFEWANKDLEESETMVSNFINELLTSYILLEYFGNRTTMSLFNSKGMQTKYYKLRSYLPFTGMFKKASEKRLFFPIY